MNFPAPDDRTPQSARCTGIPRPMLRDSVLECGASAPLSLTRPAAPRPEAQRRHTAACHRQSSRGLEHSRTLVREPVTLTSNPVGRPARAGNSRSFARCALSERGLQVIGIPCRVPKQGDNHPFMMNAEVDRIREGLGEDSAEVFVNLAVGSSQFGDRLQLAIERRSKSVAEFLAPLFIIPRNCLIKVVPDFRKHTQLLHPRLAFTKARNCSSVSAREGSCSKRSQRESSSRFSASLTSGSSVDWPIDCHSTSTSMSFSPTGSDWSLRSSAGFTKTLSNSAASHSSPDSALRASVLECGASAPLSVTRAAAPRPEAQRRRPATRHRQSSRGPRITPDRALRPGVRRSSAAFAHPPGSTSRQFQSLDLATQVCQSSRGLEHSRTLAREFISRMS